MPVTGADDHDRAAADEPVAAPPWHNSTPAVAGASVAALAVIGLVIAAAVFLTGQFGRPDSAPVEPAFTTTPATTDGALPTTTPTGTSTETITSTSPPVTSDIDLPSSTTPSSATSSSTDTTSGEPTSRRETAEPDRPDEDGGPSTTRRPRFNETRTLYPAPVN